MNHRTQILSIGSLALLCVLVLSACDDVANVGVASQVSSGQSSRLLTDNVVFKPSTGTMSLRPEANPSRGPTRS
jgi:hypothetical protein